MDSAESPRSSRLRAPARSTMRRRAATQVDALRAVLAREPRTIALPEPSPLFWDHFARASAEAVRGERAHSKRPRGPTRLRRPLATWAMRGRGDVLVILTVVWRATLHAPSPLGPGAAPSTARVRLAGNVPSIAPRRRPITRIPTQRGRSFAPRRTDLAWDDVRDAGITATPAPRKGSRWS